MESASTPMQHRNLKRQLSQGATKRARLALAEGDVAKARKEIGLDVVDQDGNDELIELYLQDLRDKEAIAFGMMPVDEQDFDSETFLMAALGALGLDASSGSGLMEFVPCPICPTGDLVADERGGVICRGCALRLVGSLSKVKDALADALEQHGLGRCSKQRPYLQVDGRGGFDLSCKECGIKLNVRAIQ